MTRIKQLRKIFKYTQEQLAKLLNVSRSTVAMWETTNQSPDYETLSHISQIFNIPHDFVMETGIFSNWDEILKYYDDVVYELRKLIPPSLEMPSFCEDKNLIAWLDTRLYAESDELQLARWFAFAVQSISITPPPSDCSSPHQEAKVIITFTPEFEALIRAEKSKRASSTPAMKFSINEKSAPSELSDEAKKIAKDYEGLDRHGRNMTKIVITEEQKRMVEELRRRETGEAEPQGTRIIPLYYTPAAAGMTSPAVGEDFDYIEISKDAPQNADFAVKIDGDSMEPYITDNSIVYVNREPLENGDVGIFYVDGDMVCKQYYKDEEGNVRLLSLNRSRRDADRFISASGDDTVLTYYGRVILPRRPMISWA